MQRPHPILHMFALGLLGLASSCDAQGTARGDLVFILADKPPTESSPLYDALLAQSLVIEGALDFPILEEGMTEILLTELLTGRRAGQKSGEEYEWQHTLPESSQLGGFRSLCTSGHADLIEKIGLDEKFDYGLFEVAPNPEEAELLHGAARATNALLRDYETKGVSRPPVFFFADLLGQNPELGVEATLAALAEEVLSMGNENAPVATPRTELLCILFVAPDAKTRLLLWGPGIGAELRMGNVAPRDIFPTFAARGGLKVPAFWDGVLVPSHLSGRGLLQIE